LTLVGPRDRSDNGRHGNRLPGGHDLMPRHHPPPIHNWFYYRMFGLGVLAAFCLRLGALYLPIFQRPVEVPKALDLITAIIPDSPRWEPIWFLGVMWVALGVFAIAAMVWWRLHNAAFIASAALTLYWAAAYAVAPFTYPAGEVTADGSSNWFTATRFLITALFVIHIGLTTRPAHLPSEEAPDPDYSSYTTGEHRV
jgi:hypothetical protein